MQRQDKTLSNLFTVTVNDVPPTKDKPYYETENDILFWVFLKGRTVAKKWYRGRQRFSADRRVVIDVLTARRTNVK
ncbi:hypothetical protein ACOMHN_051539 [Nucella lapillus]